MKRKRCGKKTDRTTVKNHCDKKNQKKSLWENAQKENTVGKESDLLVENVRWEKNRKKKPLLGGGANARA